MKTSIRLNQSYLPLEIRNRITCDIFSALNSIKTTNDKFIVNDSLFYRSPKKGVFKPCVVNSASYISSKFQSYLSDLPHGKGEIKLDGQNIDGYLEYSYSGIGYRIRDKNILLKILHEIIEIQKLPSESIYALFPAFYGMFVSRSSFGVDDIPPHFQQHFDSAKVDMTLKIGVEFETGNIASSFRALNKLAGLFQVGEIDAGVFVTSIDKPNCATRIWPSSNRNGSFQELEKRNFAKQIALPLICIGFAPDDFSETASLLGTNGDLYSLKNTGIKDTTGIYEVLKDPDGLKVYSPK